MTISENKVLASKPYFQASKLHGLNFNNEPNYGLNFNNEPNYAIKQFEILPPGKDF